MQTVLDKNLMSLICEYDYLKKLIDLSTCSSCILQKHGILNMINLFDFNCGTELAWT